MSCREYISIEDCAQTVTKSCKFLFNKHLISRFANTCELRDKNNKFILLLRKGFHPYEYMDGWEIFDGTSLPHKKTFLVA